MKAVFLGLIFAYLITITVIGIPVQMELSSLSQTQSGLYYLSSHESIVKLIKRSDITLHCSEGKTNVCARPKDYSHLKPNLPIQLEACQSGAAFPSCDDLLMRLSFSSPDLLKIGLRL